MRTKTVATLLVLGLAGGSLAQGNAILRDVRVIQVEPTVVPNRDKVKDESAAGLVEQGLKNALVRSSIEVGEAPIRARIVLEEFTGGSAMKRFMVGFGSGRSTLDARLVVQSADGKELANIRLRVRGDLLFSSYQDNDQQARQATSEFDKKLIEEIAKLRGPATATSTVKAPASSEPARAPATTSSATTSPAAAAAPASNTVPTPPPVAAPAPPVAAPTPPAPTTSSSAAAKPPAPAGAPATPAVEGLGPQQVSDLLGRPAYVLEGRDGVTTWFYEIDGKPVRVFIYEGKASLSRQR